MTEIRKIKSQQSGGLLLPPVQTLVATLIFATGKNANESPADHIFALRKYKRIDRRSHFRSAKIKPNRPQFTLSLCKNQPPKYNLYKNQETSCKFFRFGV
jgi:hypothetical protein